MIAFKPKLWRSFGAAAVLAVAACGGEGGEGGGTGGEGGEGGETGEAGAAAPAPSAETATAPAAGAGEAGEAGATSAYAGLSGDQLKALRLQHLLGFVRAAATVNAENMPAEASVLVSQGLLEVYDSAPTEFGTLDVSLVRAAAEDSTLNRAQMMTRLRAAEAEIVRASGSLDAEAAITVARMVDIATGLYQEVIHEDYVDPIEYQHSMGAAQAAQAALSQHSAELRSANVRAFSEAQAALARFTGLWPQATAPETPTPYREVLAQGSRVRLALSPYL